MIVDTPAERLEEVPIERIGPMDVTVLVTDRGSVPMNIGAVLQFDGTRAVRHLPPSVPTVRTRSNDPSAASAAAAGSVRLRAACMVGHPDFVLDRHLIEREWPAPGGDKQLLDVAAELLCQRLEIDRPLWLACLLTDLASTGPILVLHHVLADGLGGLAILAALADPGLMSPPARFHSLRRGGGSWSLTPRMR